MTQNPASTVEDARLEAVQSCAVLGDTPDPRFAEVGQLAATILDVPYAMVCLIDEHHQQPLATVGFTAEATPRAGSFGEAVLGLDDAELLLLADASGDPRFASDGLLGAPTQVRFVAGAPLRCEGGPVLGALLLFDSQPRSLDARARALLTSLAARVVDLLELHRAAAELAHARAHLDSLATLIPICSHCRKVRNEANKWQTLERLVQAKTGSRFTHGICPDCVREHYPDAADELLRVRHRTR